MPQIYIREDQYDRLVSLNFDDRDALLEFVRTTVNAGIEKEERRRKKAGKK